MKKMIGGERREIALTAKILIGMVLLAIFVQGAYENGSSAEFNNILAECRKHHKIVRTYATNNDKIFYEINCDIIIYKGSKSNFGEVE